MTKRDRDRLEEAEAREVWRRAARFQAEASQEPAETESENLALGPPAGHEITAVREAAIEAGIEERFVVAALAEVQAERSLPVVTEDRALAARFFGGLLDAVTVRRTIEASASDALSIIINLLPREPYILTLSEKRGDPLDSGALVFDIEGLGSVRKPWLANEVSASAVRQVYVSLRPVGDGPATCEVTFQGPIAWSHNTGLVHGLVVSAVGGGVSGTVLGGVVATALGGLLVTPIGWVVTGVSAATGLVLGGALGRQGYRAFCRYGIERARRALEKMLLAVAVQAEQRRAVVSEPRDDKRDPAHSS